MSTSAGRVLIIPKGEYSSGTTYEMLDLVRFGKGTFICKKTSTGNEPSFVADTEYWQLVATSGDVSGVKGNAEATYRDGNVNITYDNIGGVDSALSSSSELPVQNKVVKAALDLKLDDPGYDDAPTAYSTKLVNSGNIKNALDNKLAVNGDTKNNIATFRSVDDASTLAKTTSGMTTGGRNYLPNELITETKDGITFTRNANGTITVDGEATDSGSKEITTYTLKSGTYIITDGDNNGLVSVIDTDSSTEIADTEEANQEFTLAADTEITVQIDYTSGDIIDNLTLSPMIRLSTDSDTTFEMYYYTVPALVSGDTHKGLFAKISAIFANVRKLWNTVGEENISDIGATITGAIGNLSKKGTADLLYTINSTGTELDLAHPITDYNHILVMSVVPDSGASELMLSSDLYPVSFISDHYNTLIYANYASSTRHAEFKFVNASQITVTGVSQLRVYVYGIK